MRPTRIILHHSLTKDGTIVNWEAIRRFHTSWRDGGTIITEAEARSRQRGGSRTIVAPWKDIGYHLGFELHADPIDGPRPIALLGRPFNWVGAHTVGHNVDTWGVCFVGNYDVETVPDMLLRFAAKHVAGLLSAAGLPATRDTLRMHGEFAPKSCPGKLFPYATFVDQVAWFLRMGD